MSKFNRFTTGRIPADEGAIMAELDEPGDEPNFDLFGSFGLDFFSDVATIHSFPVLLVT